MKNLYEHRFEHIDLKTDFIMTFLLEMPEKVLVGDAYRIIIHNIKEWKDNKISPIIQLSNNLYKMEGLKVIYYWYGSSDDILLGVELEKRSLALVVRFIGKNPTLKGQPPFASDLYNDILKDQKSPIRLISDDKLSDEGYNIWKKLFTAGHKIGVYKKGTPGHTFRKLSSQAEMDQFFGMNKSSKDPMIYKDYQYVILESGSLSLETCIYFNSRKYFEINNALNPGIICTGGDDFDLNVLDD